MFYERIKELRLSLKMNQVQFAWKLNITKQCVSKWESAEIQPSVDMLKKIAETFSVSTDYLLGIEPQNSIDVSGLSMEEIVHLQNIVNDLKSAKKSSSSF
ncbi:MAG: helix-turn-helix transcriptional regulator [Oscillospiraceae bacterium]|nr:helix-turn-helix transcriptional regulator [Oscillospiraceae bacterium]